MEKVSLQKLLLFIQFIGLFSINQLIEYEFLIKGLVCSINSTILQRIHREKIDYAHKLLLLQKE